jgi:hypothetical protein
MSSRNELISRILNTLELNREVHDQLMGALGGLPSVWDAAVVLAMASAWTAHLLGKETFLTVFEILYDSSGPVAVRKKQELGDVDD